MFSEDNEDDFLFSSSIARHMLQLRHTTDLFNDRWFVNVYTSDNTAVISISGYVVTAEEWQQHGGIPIVRRSELSLYRHRSYKLRLSVSLCRSITVGPLSQVIMRSRVNRVLPSASCWQNNVKVDASHTLCVSLWFIVLLAGEVGTMNSFVMPVIIHGQCRHIHKL